jgi:hypothetical protein
LPSCGRRKARSIFTITGCILHDIRKLSSRFFKSQSQHRLSIECRFRSQFGAHRAPLKPNDSEGWALAVPFLSSGGLDTMVMPSCKRNHGPTEPVPPGYLLAQTWSNLSVKARIFSGCSGWRVWRKRVAVCLSSCQYSGGCFQASRRALPPFLAANSG